MSPSWSTSPLPTRPGFFQNFLKALAAALSQGVTGTVVVIGTADWGPVATPTAISTQGQLDNTFWKNTTGSLREGATKTLNGLDTGGANTVQAYRIANAPVVGVAQLNDVAKASAILLKARYPGTRTNNWTVNVVTNATNAKAKDVTLLESGVILSTYQGIVQSFAEVVLVGKTESGKATVKGLSSTTGLIPGMEVTGTGIPGATKIKEINSSTEITLTASAESTQAADVLTFKVAEPEGTNDAIVAAINVAGDPYVVAELSGAAGRKMENITGVIGGAGSFGTGSGVNGVAGTDGEALTQENYVTALNNVAGIIFDAVILAGISDVTTQTTFVTWLKNLNENIQRAFGVIGGKAGETITTAVERSRGYNNRDLVSVGYTELRAVTSGEVQAPYQLIGQVAGSISNVGLRRSLTNVKYTGYQVVVSPNNAGYEQLSAAGVLTFTSDTPTRVRVEQGLTTFTQPGPEDPPSAHKYIRNVAIDHFVTKTLTKEAMEDDVGILLNTESGRNNYVGAVLAFLKALENQVVLAAGKSTVNLDTRFNNEGAALFVDTEYQYVQTIERFLLSSRVS